jgi:epoxyqueuosine reductase
MMDKAALTKKVKEFANECGLDLIGITGPEAFRDYIGRLTPNAFMYEPGYTRDRVEKWIKMAQPKEVMPEAKSVIVAGFYYLTGDTMDSTAPGKPCGKIARVLTHGHSGVYKRIVKLAEFLTDQGFQVKGGIHRKSAAVRAGLGFIGKNTLVSNERFGSWVAYQVLVTDAELEFDAPSTIDGCGNCRACVDACPTNALYEPYKIDPRRCITYILNQEKIPAEFRDKIGNRILGCDICQDVCPKNKVLSCRKDAESVLPEKIGVSPSLLALLAMNEETFKSEVLAGIGEKFSQTSGTFVEEMVPNTFQKAGGKIMVYMRNVLLALGNIGDPAAVPYLAKALMFPHPLIRSQAAWSLGRIGTTQSKEALEKALNSESDGEVRAEMEAALKRIGEA